MRTNSGLASRFNHIVNFRDYTGPELAEIFKRMASQSQQGYRLAEGMDNDILAFFERCISQGRAISEMRAKYEMHTLPLASV